MIVSKRKSTVTVTIPSSTIRDTPHLREKTLRLGFIGRAFAIFRIDNILIYRDKGEDESELIAKILKYMEAPQYIRKKIFELTPGLKFAGILPPLRTPNHPLKKPLKELKIGEIREGVVIKTLRDYSLVDIGLDSYAVVRKQFPLKTLLNVKITSLKNIEAMPVRFGEIPYFWGFNVKAMNQSLDETIKNGNFDVTIATSRYGQPIKVIASELVERWMNSKNVLIAFGSPSEGINEILSRKKININDIFDYTVNTIKDQGVETVRIEEALTASLAVFNSLIDQ